MIGKSRPCSASSVHINLALVRIYGILTPSTSQKGAAIRALDICRILNNGPRKLRECLTTGKVPIHLSSEVVLLSITCVKDVI